MAEEIQQIEILNKGLQIQIQNQEKLDLVLDDLLVRMTLKSQ